MSGMLRCFLCSFGYSPRFMSEPRLIDHNPQEQRPTNRIWWVLLAILVFAWIGTGVFFGFDWHQIGLGGFTGIVLALWAIEITGDKTPEWMK